MTNSVREPAAVWLSVVKIQIIRYIDVFFHHKVRQDRYMSTVYFANSTCFGAPS